MAVNFFEEVFDTETLKDSGINSSQLVQVSVRRKNKQRFIFILGAEDVLSILEV